MKKLLAITLVFCMSFSLTSCFDENEQKTSESYPTISIDTENRSHTTETENIFTTTTDYPSGVITNGSTVGTTTGNPTENIPTQTGRKVFLREVTPSGEIGYNHIWGGLQLHFKPGQASTYDYYITEGYLHCDTNLFPFLYDGRKYGYCDAQGNIVIDAMYYSADCFYEGKAVIATYEPEEYEYYGITHTKEFTTKIIDTAGNVLYTPAPELEILTGFKNGKLFMLKSEKKDRITEKYESEWYLTVVVLSEDMTTTEIPLKKIDQNRQLRIINTDDFCGIITWRSERKEGAQNYEDYNNIFEMYDLSGNLVWSAEVDGACGDIYKEIDIVGSVETNLSGFMVENGYMNIVNEQGKWGLFDLSTRKVKIPCQYDYLGAYSNGLIEVCQNDEWGYIDINGNQVIRPVYLYATSFSEGYAFVENAKNEFAVIDTTGNVVANYSNLGFANVSGRVGYQMVTPFIKEVGMALMCAGNNKFSLLASDGRKLLTIDDTSAQIFISKTHVFDGEKMYEIVWE